MLQSQWIFMMHSRSYLWYHRLYFVLVDLHLIGYVFYILLCKTVVCCLCICVHALNDKSKHVWEWWCMLIFWNLITFFSLFVFNEYMWSRMPSCVMSNGRDRTWYKCYINEVKCCLHVFMWQHITTSHSTLETDIAKYRMIISVLKSFWICILLYC